MAIQETRPEGIQTINYLIDAPLVAAKLMHSKPNINSIAVLGAQGKDDADSLSQEIAYAASAWHGATAKTYTYSPDDDEFESDIGEIKNFKSIYRNMGELVLVVSNLDDILLPGRDGNEQKRKYIAQTLGGLVANEQMKEIEKPILKFCAVSNFPTANDIREEMLTAKQDIDAHDLLHLIEDKYILQDATAYSTAINPIVLPSSTVQA